jgi:prepilin-type N-terminal cleavage/methylation domain-containing protein
MMKGFTLIEVLVVMVVFSVMVIAIYDTLSAGNSVFNVSSGLLDLTQEARTAMSRLIKEVRGASSLTVNSASNITFSTPSVSNVLYYLSGTSLVRSDSGGTQVLASHVSNLTFSNPGGQNTVLQVLLIVGKPVFLRNLTYSLMEEVRLRNE